MLESAQRFKRNEYRYICDGQRLLLFFPLNLTMFNGFVCSNTETVFIIYIYILLSVNTVCKLFLWNSLFFRQKKAYFDLIRVICFKPPYILRTINLLTTNCAYLLYKGWMYAWERMCVESGEYCCRIAALWRWGLFFYCIAYAHLLF